MLVMVTLTYVPALLRTRGNVNYSVVLTLVVVVILTGVVRCSVGILLGPTCLNWRRCRAAPRRTVFFLHLGWRVDGRVDYTLSIWHR